MQVSLFEVEETEDDRRRRFYDLQGRAFELECQAGETNSEAKRKRLLDRAASLVAESKTIGG